MKNMEVTTSEAPWTAVTKGKEKTGVEAGTAILKRRSLKATGLWSEGERRLRESWDEGGEVQSPKRKVTRVESEETQD